MSYIEIAIFTRREHAIAVLQHNDSACMRAVRAAASGGRCNIDDKCIVI